MGAGKAIVSTPYAYASERLAQGRGRLVAAGSTRSARGRHHRAGAGRLAACRARAPGVRPQPEHALARGRRGVSTDLRPCRRIGRPAAPTSRRPARRWLSRVPDRPLVPVRRRHLEELSGPLGIWQHADGVVPDESFGTCTDDVARALTVDLLHRRELGWEAVSPSARRSMAFLAAAFDPVDRLVPQLPRCGRHMARGRRIAGQPGARAAGPRCGCPGRSRGRDAGRGARPVHRGAARGPDA